MDRESLSIEEHAWEHVCKAGIKPRMIFAHPEILKAIPQSSLHYRGIALHLLQAGERHDRFN